MLDNIFSIDNQKLGNAPLIIAASPITKQPNTLPYRVVLRYLPSHITVEYTSPATFVVHNQVWREDGTSSFSDGDYFIADQFVEAVNCWHQRVSRDLQNLRSIERTELD